MISLVRKAKGSLHGIDAAIVVAVLFSLLIPLIQVALHVLARSRLIFGNPGTPSTNVGVLFNLPDLLSYAAWASQAKLGYVTFLDLFTTEAHSRALFNLYFLIVGLLSRLMAVDPLSLMEMSLLLLGPVSVFAVLLTARGLKFDGRAQALSLVFVFLGSGISGLLVTVGTNGSQWLPHFAWLSQLLRPGADALYHEFFPLLTLVFYPYHAAAFVLLALIFWMSTRVLSASGGPGPVGRATLLGALFFITGLVRPYETVTLSLAFNMAALFGVVADRGTSLRQTLATCFVVDFLALPPIAYAGFMATRPVWGSFAQSSMTLEPMGSAHFLKGFVILWGFAILGLKFAVADRKKDLCFAACWAIVGAALLCLSPSYGTKFAGGSMLPNGLLAAYGVGRLIQESSTRERRRSIRRLLIGAIGVMVLTPIAVFADILQVGPPQIDAELLTAGRRIRDLEGTRIPVVLTDAAAGTVLPGFFGERVYAGHWSLTPDFRTKTALLKRAGVEVSSPTGNGYDRDALAELVRDTRANYILLKRTAAAAQAIATCSHSEPVFEGERWIAVSASDWSCP